MSDQNEQAAAPTDAPEQQTETVEQPPEQRMVSKDELDRVLGEMHQFKTKYKDATAKLEQAETNKLRESENHMELAKRFEQQAKDERERADKIQSSFSDAQKFAVAKESALKSGMLPEAINDLPLVDGFDSELQVETTSTGRMNVLNADAWMDKVKILKPHWFSNQRVPNINTTTVGVGQPEGPVDITTVLKLEREAKKSGDTTAYKLALTKYQQQQRGG